MLSFRRRCPSFPLLLALLLLGASLLACAQAAGRGSKGTKAAEEAAPADDAAPAEKAGGADAVGEAAPEDAGGEKAEEGVKEGAGEEGAKGEATETAAAGDAEAEKAVSGEEGTEKGPADEAGAKGDGAAAKAGAKGAKGEGAKAATPDPKISMASKKLADLTTKDNCSKEAQAFCADVTPGDSKLLDCLTNEVKLEKAGNAPKDAIPISDECKNEMRAFRIELYKDISMDKAMAAACKEDIAMYCDDDFLYPEPGNVLACLRETKQSDKLSEGCKEHVVEAQEAGASDFKLDPQLNEICSSEAERLCKGVTPGEGRIQDCLRSHRNVLAWDCQAELFRQEVEDADDIRLNVRLYKACLDDKKKFCPDVVPGDARVKDCLESHLDDSDFSQTCKVEFTKMMERRARDFRLDSSLRKYCKQDIAEICYPDAEDISDVANWDSKVIECLQDYRDELKDPRCRQQVHQLTKRSAGDIRMDRPLAEACEADHNAYCKDVPEGHARVFMCLQDNRAKLKDSCRYALFEQEVRYAEDIDFKFPMREACKEELKRFCDKIIAGQGDVVKCLQDHVEDADMGKTCKSEVKKDEQHSAEDYRLNYKLNKECFSDVERLCLHSCDKLLEAGSQTCGGTVLKCLSQNAQKLKSKACKEEVFYFQKKEVEDIQLDVPLQKACKGDITKLCPDISKDHSRTLGCLRNKRDSLTEECKAEELRFSTMEASDVRLSPTLMNACSLELQQFCRQVSPEAGQAFRCLQMNVDQPGMGIACKAEVNLQTLQESSYYALDTSLSLQCESDIAKSCARADAGQEGHALVLKCLIEHHPDLAGPCQTEVSYLVRMALWMYHKGAELTSACDATVDALCGKNETTPEVNGVVVGVWGQCLTDKAAAGAVKDNGCMGLVSVVAVEGAHVGGMVDDNKLQETLNKLTQLQLAAASRGGGKRSARPQGLVLTGWIAFAAITALTAVLLGVGYFVYRKYFDPTRNYTLVVKAGDV